MDRVAELMEKIRRDIANANIEQVVLDQLQENPRLRVRRVVNEQVVQDYMARFDELPPVVVVRLNGVLYIVDGYHRVEAARRSGRTEIRAVVLEDMEEVEALRLAIRLNLPHGLRLTRADRRYAAEQWLRLHPEATDRRIAEETGLTHKTVARIRKRLETSGDIPQLATRVGRDGKHRPAHRRVVHKDEAAGVRLHEELPTPGSVQETTTVLPLAAGDLGHFMPDGLEQTESAIDDAEADHLEGLTDPVVNGHLASAQPPHERLEVSPTTVGRVSLPDLLRAVAEWLQAAADLAAGLGEAPEEQVEACRRAAWSLGRTVVAVLCPGHEEAARHPLFRQLEAMLGKPPETGPTDVRFDGTYAATGKGEVGISTEAMQHVEEPHGELPTPSPSAPTAPAPGDAGGSTPGLASPAASSSQLPDPAPPVSVKPSRRGSRRRTELTPEQVETAKRLLDEVRRRGANVKVVDGRIRIPDASCIQDLMEILYEHRRLLIAFLADREGRPEDGTEEESAADSPGPELARSG